MAPPAGMTDEEVIRAFPPYQGAGEPGFVTDYLGTRTRTEYIALLPQAGGVVEGYPIPQNFHANALEWACVLRAVLASGDDLVAVELGAGWAPWLVAVARAARLCGERRVRLVGVEGSRAALRVHAHPLRRQRAGTGGTHPAPRGGRGGRRRGRVPGAGRPGRPLGGPGRPLPGPMQPGADRVRCYSLATLLHPFATVDLVHIDIQGDEVEVIAAAREVLKAKVRRVVVGTHSRAIEQALFDEMAAQSWVLEAEESCRFRQKGQGMELAADGCQGWRNEAFDPSP